MSLQMPENLPAPEFSQNAEVVLAKRYRRWDASGEHQESTREMFWRVASAIAEEEGKYAKSPYTPEELAELRRSLKETYAQNIVEYLADLYAEEGVIWCPF